MAVAPTAIATGITAVCTRTSQPLTRPVATLSFTVKKRAQAAGLRDSGAALPAIAAPADEQRKKNRGNERDDGQHQRTFATGKRYPRYSEKPDGGQNRDGNDDRIARCQRQPACGSLA